MDADAIYDRLNPAFRAHVDQLADELETLLWPDRRAAFEAFHRGIAKCPGEQIAAALDALDIAAPPGEDDAERLHRVLLTACLGRLGEAEVTNADQAALYALSLDERHAAAARAWQDAHPEHAASVASRSGGRA